MAADGSSPDAPLGHDSLLASPPDAGPAPWLVATFYRFAPLSSLPELREALAEGAAALGLRGTILLAGEGVNGTVCGAPASVAALLERLRAVPGLEGLRARCSRAGAPVFGRLRVRIRPEIVSLGRPGLRPYLDAPVATPLAPAAWDERVADPRTLVIDTRNAFEVGLGSFPGALDPGLASFRSFPAWVERELRPRLERQRPEAIALFCTGGIRCEKAGAELLRRGFRGVHQLQGGILRYLEEVPEPRSRWRGECFVFDQRLAVTHRLEPTRLHHLALGPEWRAAEAEGVYRRSTRGLSLEQVGFIHASFRHQLAATFARFYADAEDVLLLTIDPLRLAAAGVAVRCEPAPESGELFPHLYGPLPRQAVLAVEPWAP